MKTAQETKSEQLYNRLIGCASIIENWIPAADIGGLGIEMIRDAITVMCTGLTIDRRIKIYPSETSFRRAAMLVRELFPPAGSGEEYPAIMGLLSLMQAAEAFHLVIMTHSLIDLDADAPSWVRCEAYLATAEHYLNLAADQYRPK